MNYKKLIKRISLLFLSGFILSGCTKPTVKEQLDDWGVGKFVNVQVGNGTGSSPSVSKEALLAHAFTIGGNDVEDTVRKFTKQQEGFAQNSLTNDKENLATVWTNKFYGEIKFIPGEYYKNSGRQCRKFVGVWVVHSMGATPQNKRGKACQNPATKRWEWSYE